MSQTNFIIRLKKDSDNDAVAALIMDSLNVWYRKNRGFESCVPSLEAASIYTRIYDALDPDCCVVAEDALVGLVPLGEALPPLGLRGGLLLVLVQIAAVPVPVGEPVDVLPP